MYKCRSCKKEVTAEKPVHVCQNFTCLYRPNASRGKNSDPAYRKRFGSRAK